MADWRLSINKYREFVDTLTEDCIDQVFRKVQSLCPIEPRHFIDYSNPTPLPQEDMEELKQLIISKVDKWAEMNLTPCRVCGGESILESHDADTGEVCIVSCYECKGSGSNAEAAVLSYDFGYEWDMKGDKAVITKFPPEEDRVTKVDSDVIDYEI